MEVTAKGLGSQMGAVLACLNRGETVTVTYRGKPRAKLVGIEQEGGAKQQGESLPAFGMWRDRADMVNVEAYLRGLRNARDAG